MTVNANGPNIKKIDDAEEEEGEKLENGLDDQAKKEIRIALPRKPVVKVITADQHTVVCSMLTVMQIKARNLYIQ